MKQSLDEKARAALRNRLGFLDDEQVAAFYGISVLTLRNRRSKGTIAPAAKVGREYLTKEADLLADVARRRRQAAT
jgi:hypothetical protein